MTDSEYSLKNRMVSGSGWAIMGKTVSMITAFLSVPLVLGYLGPQRMGLWRLSVSVLMVVSLLSAGLVPYLKTSMVEAIARRDLKAFREYASTGLLIGLVVVMLGGLAALAAPIIDWNHLMKVTDPLARQEAVPLIMIVSIYTFMQIGTSIIPAIYDARIQVAKPRIYELIGGVTGFLLMLLGIGLRVSLPVLALLMTAPNIMVRLALLPGLRSSDREIFLPKVSFFKRICREIVGPGSLAIGIQGGSILISMVPNILVVRTLSLDDVASFSIAFQLASLPLAFIAAVVPVFWPAFTMAWRTGKEAVVRRWLARILGATSLMLVLYSIWLGFLGPAFIRLWTRGAVNVDGVLMFLLGVFVAIQGVLYWLSTFLWSLSELWIQFMTQTAAAVAIIVLGDVLARRTGMPGLALAMAIGLGAGALIPMWWRTRKVMTAPARPVPRAFRDQSEAAVPIPSTRVDI